MDDTERAARARSFGTVSGAYAAHRPDYPVEAVRWLVPDAGARVVELGAGTGKLTETLLAERHRVVATDPAHAMLTRLTARHRTVRAIQSAAEQIPVHAGAADVVVAAQAFHWFDHRRALPEIARVLRPGGTLSLVWNDRDQGVPWVRRLSAIIGAEDRTDDPVEVVETSGLFDGIETRTFRHWQQIDRDSLVGLVESRSNVATMAEQQRADVLARVGALYDDYGRGHDGMLLPYLTRCYRAHLSSTHSTGAGNTGSGGTGQEPTDGLDDGLLIDFS